MSYLKITNGGGKQWVIPQRNMAVGLMLYQPSVWTGKVLKCALPWVAWSRLMRKVLRIDVCESPLDDMVVSYLKEQFLQEDIECSIFMGTPSPNQKITVQISCGKKILGYCKLTKSERINELFVGEEETLGFLHSLGVEQIPQCLDIQRFDNGYYTFLQSTRKTMRSSVAHKLDERHFEFVEDLVKRTSIDVAYDESDFGKMMILLREHLGCFTKEERAVLTQALDMVEGYYRDLTSYCYYHGDFTPWNTFIEDSSLYVFDWEYAKRSCPPYMDLMHFVGQVAIFEKHLTPEKIVDEYSALFPLLKDKVKSPVMLYLAYLLYIFALYNSLYDWQWDAADRCYSAWLRQIEKLLGED